MSLYCSIGWHRYRLVRILEQRGEILVLSLDGWVCRGCDLIRAAHIIEARRVMADMRRILPDIPIIAHPALADCAASGNEGSQVLTNRQVVIVVACALVAVVWMISYLPGSV